MDGATAQIVAPRWTRSTTIRAAAPALAVLLVLWLVTFRSLSYPNWVDNNFWLWQSLGRDNLLNEPWDSLRVLHIQPPGLNALQAVDLLLTPSSHYFLGIVFLTMAGLTTVMVVDVLLHTGVSQWVGIIAGLIYVLLPGTVVYSLYPFTTAPTAFAATVAVWGVSLMRRHAVVGAVISAVGMALLTVLRSSFVWPVALVWMLAVALYLLRLHPARRGRMAGVSAVVALAAAVLGLQAHYFTAFGLTTMSSWTGENLAKALTQSGALSVSKETEASIRKDPCQAQLLDELIAGDPPIWMPERFRALPGCSSLPTLPGVGVAAWDHPAKDGVDDGERRGNFNWSDRLVASRVWADLMTDVLKGDPGQLVRMALTTPSGPRESGLGIYLSPSEDYSLVTPIRDSLPLATITGVLSLLFAPSMVVFALIGLVSALARPSSRLRKEPVFWFMLALVGYHIAVSTLVEYGENMRFQAEVAPVLLLLGVMGATELTRGSQTDQAATNRVDLQPAVDDEVA